jgi:tetratricopeptide (TPR) repeat protein
VIRVDQGEEADHHLALAEAAVKVFDVDAAVAHLSTALRAFMAIGNHRQAAMTCARLGDLYATAMGNLTVARAWFARAMRLVQAEPLCVEQGWVAVAAMGCDVDEPALLLERAELALDRARRFGDVNLETKALADAGLAHVQAGRVAEGMALLDEAMALACGPADDTDVAGKSVCSFFTACYFAADFERAGSWAGTLRQRGLIGLGTMTPIFLSSHCDSVQATLLCELGRWAEAEAVLTRAIAEFERCMPVPSWHPAIALADLRIRQGRLTDAETLLLGKDGHLQALLPAARLHLARGDHALARAVALRGLRVIGSDRLRAAELLAVLIEVELATGNLNAARAACDDLLSRTDGVGMPALEARTAPMRARVLAATGDLASAVAMIQSALDRGPNVGAPCRRASLHLELARLHEQAGKREAAIVEARAAAAILDGLDVVLPAEYVALLRRLGVPRGVDSTRSASHVASLQREGRWWVAACDTTQARLSDTKGLRYLAELVRDPGVERHVLDLVDRVEGVDPEGMLDRRRIGDAGALVDGAARAAYRHRIEVLRAEIDDTLSMGELDRAEALQVDLDQLVQQLAQAFGLGSGARRVGSAAERARLNVTRALRKATASLAEVLPEAGTLLDRRLRTGLYCCYDPSESDEVHWRVHSRVNGSQPD